MTVDRPGLPVGRPVPGWTARPRVGGIPLHGRTCAVVPYQKAHVPALHRALDLDSPDAVWAYYPQGPFEDEASLGTWLDALAAGPDVEAYTVVVDGVPAGIATYLRMDPANGVVEVGNIVLGAALQRTTAATEAMYLMMRHVFELGYRRYEWKCDDLNAASRRAAGRLGFGYEGTFRNVRVYRDRNRDTAWYAILREDWPAIRTELERWLDPANLDDDGRQRTRLDMATALGYSPPRAPQDR